MFRSCKNKAMSSKSTACFGFIAERCHLVAILRHKTNTSTNYSCFFPQLLDNKIQKQIQFPYLKYTDSSMWFVFFSSLKWQPLIFTTSFTLLVCPRIVLRRTLLNCFHTRPLFLRLHVPLEVGAPSATSPSIFFFSQGEKNKLQPDNACVSCGGRWEHMGGRREDSRAATGKVSIHG